VQIGKLHLPCLVSAVKPAEARHSVVLLMNAESMEVKVSPVEVRIRKQLSPTLEVEGGLVFGGVQLARQRHYREVYSESVRIRGGL
jgi:hypothetical protein